VLRRQRKHSTTHIHLLIVGLGNPGKKYENTRHNVGFEALDHFALKHEGRFKRTKELSFCSEIRINNEKIILAKPTTFMNESGLAVQKLVRKYGIENLDKLLIIHDELDLKPGVLKLKLYGGLAGHNGLKSISKHLKSNDFARLRIGVGKPSQGQLGKNYVLKPPSRTDKIKIDDCIKRTTDVIEAILVNGYETTMNEFNREIQ
jgi:PTH1 family peptidyl-tRNA hydrolase|tara:strand:+ start:47825 stop:48436 length:612 start_codon:yes stop_codon:yes gene_type:complete